MRSYEQALQRLALDTVDALVIHDLDSVFHDRRASPGTRSSCVEQRHQGARRAEERRATSRPIGMGINNNGRLKTLAHAGRPRFLPCRHALHPARSGEPACRNGDLPEAWHLGHHWRAICLGHSGDGFSWSGALCLWQGPCRHDSAKVRGIEAVCARTRWRCQPPPCNSCWPTPSVASVIPGAAKPEEMGRTSPRCRPPFLRPSGLTSSPRA